MSTSVAGAVAEIGIIGGSGFYSFLPDAVPHPVSTPFGPPSDDPVVGEVAGRSVAFLPRHGKDHRHPPHRVNYRANLWALRSLGVRQVLAPCAVGSLTSRHDRGTLVIPDQVVDRTTGRQHTVYDETGPVVHVGFADPYCPAGRAAFVSASAAHVPVHDGGTLVVINGPRFSSRAESAWHAAAGWDVVGMTGMPETAVARELAMCFSTACLVTDHDAGVEGQEAVTHESVMAEFGRSVTRLKDALHDVIAALPETEPDESASCGCRRALDGLTLPWPLP